VNCAHEIGPETAGIEVLIVACGIGLRKAKNSENILIEENGRALEKPTARFDWLCQTSLIICLNGALLATGTA